MNFGPFRFTTLFSSQTGTGDVPSLQNLQFNLHGRLAGLDDFTEEHSHRLEREGVTWQGLVFIKTDDGGPPLALSERGLGFLQRQASMSNCPLDWKNGLSVIIEGEYLAHNIGYGRDKEIEMRLFLEPFDSPSLSRYLTVKSLSRIAVKRSLRNLDAAKILDHLSMICSFAPADSLLDLRTVEWCCRMYKQSFPNFVPIDEPPKKYGVTTHISDVASALARHLIRPGFQDELVTREILTKDQIDIFLEKAYTIWRMPFSKRRSCWGTWRKGIGGSEDPPHHLKVEDVKPTNKSESLETNTQIPGFPYSIKAEERLDSPSQQKMRKHTALSSSRTTSTARLSNSQSQPPVLPTASRAESRTSEEMDITPLSVAKSAVSFDIDPEERELLLRIPLELFYPPPPPEHCGNGRFRWNCPIRGCAAVLDSASNYMDLFPGFGEIEANWLRTKPESLDGEIGREVIRHIQSQHYEFHLKDSRVDLVDGKLVSLD